MKVTLILFITLITTIFFSCKSSKPEEEEYKNHFGIEKDARVVFVGNSITNRGLFHNNILLYHLTRFPDKNIRVYNSGVSGGVAQGVLDRMEEDILIHKPTHAIIMLGMNDVGRDWYGTAPTTHQDTLLERKKRLIEYKENMEKIVAIFLKKDITVLLERPTIYDQTAVLPEKNHYGVNDALGICALYADSLAQKNGLATIDYFGIMNRINAQMQKKDSSYTLTGQDRIHPGETGHFIMSYEFLKTENAPKYVSQILIDSKKKKADGSKNCVIRNLTTEKGGISFSVTENALPFPIKKEQKEGLELAPFMGEFNVELLKVTQLNLETEYQLKIDDVFIGSFTGKQFDEGINLAEFTNTPQYEQSKKVLETLQERWEAESKLRGMKFIQYLPQFKKMKVTEDLKTIETFMDSAFVADGYTNPYYKSQLKIYIANKPKEEAYKAACKQLIEKAYLLAQPVEHTYLVTNHN